MIESTEKIDTLADVRPYLADVITQAVPQEILTVTTELQKLYKNRVKAVLMYGSTLRDPDFNDAVVDLYLLVDGYTDLYSNAMLGYFNELIAPNVFYIEVQHGQSLIRCKYAVVSILQFIHGCSNWFHSYLWGRFCQPVRLVYAESIAVQADVITALTHSCYNLLSNACIDDPGKIVTAEQLWAGGLSLSYSAELRPENIERATALVQSDKEYYRELTELIIPSLNERYATVETGIQITADKRLVKKLHSRWRWRRLLGKLLSILRLTKAAFTFYDCVDYAAWKIQRHTGEVIEVTPKLRKYPLLFGWQVCWRLLRRGVLK